MLDNDVLSAMNLRREIDRTIKGHIVEMNELGFETYVSCSGVCLDHFDYVGIEGYNDFLAGVGRPHVAILTEYPKKMLQELAYLGAKYGWSVKTFRFEVIKKDAVILRFKSNDKTCDSRKIMAWSDLMKCIRPLGIINWDTHKVSRLKQVRYHLIRHLRGIIWTGFYLLCSIGLWMLNIK